MDWNPTTNVLTDRFIPPEGFVNGLKGHVFGTDQLGRDMLVRLLIGGQYSLRIAAVSVILQTIIAVVMGIAAGYFGGWLDAVVMRVADAVMALPALVMAIAVMAVLGASERNLIIVLTISGWVPLCKVIRNNVRIIKRQEFVSASKALGAKGFHIMFSQIFPNTTTSMIIISSQRFGVMILIEAALSFLNLGIQAPAPSWGNMISAGRTYLTTQPWLILVPGIALMLSVLSFNFLGDGIRDVLDTKRKA
jgi:peptide/nickel transport system permease protein